MNADAFAYYTKKLQAKPDAADRIVPVAHIDPEQVKRIHLLGICGKAMASLAGLLVKAGYIVTGSDDAWNPPMSTTLEHIGIKGAVFSVDNLIGVDVVVVGNAFTPANIEAVEARRLGIPQISASDAYAQFFIKDATSIVVAGTHGKTTTSSLMAQVFLHAQQPTNILVGGILRNTGESYHYAPDAQYSIVEGDEYDTAYFDKAPKFLHYRPSVAIITSVEFDHADIYTDMTDYLQAFVFLAAEVPVDGTLLLFDAIPAEYKKVISAACKGKVYEYGQQTASPFRVERIRTVSAGSEKGEMPGQYFDVVLDGVVYKDFFIPLFGIYNVENALTVIATALQQGIDEQSVKEAIADFKGAEQRQQILCDVNNIIVMSDFAHHPTAVAVTLQGVRDCYPDRRIIAVFEPRSNTSRRKDFEEPYSKAFTAANIVLLSKPIVRWNDSSDAMMDISVVIAGITSIPGTITTEAAALEGGDAMVSMLEQMIRPGDVVVCMSNGFFDGVPQRIADWVTTL